LNDDKTNNNKVNDIFFIKFGVYIITNYTLILLFNN